MNMRSRNYRYSIIERRNLKSYKRSIVLYLILTVFILIISLYIGIPLIVKALNLSELFKKSNSIIVSNDTIPPIPPKFYNIPAYTNQSSQYIEGTGEPGSNVVIIINNKES